MFDFEYPCLPDFDLIIPVIAQGKPFNTIYSPIAKSYDFLGS